MKKIKYLGKIQDPKDLVTKEYVDGQTSDLVPEAPEDGKQYARKDGEWEEVVAGGIDYFTVQNGKLCIVYEEV